MPITKEGRPVGAPPCMSECPRGPENSLIRLLPELAHGLHRFSMEDSMGTVGLSFGSPTSGAGFDVSTTVAEIVGNLQNVETPWKNQLTSLESQDSTISSLGTLFSNLSNDISSLTDFQGILAQKEGSRSEERRVG